MKGKAEPVAAYALIGVERAQRRACRRATELPTGRPRAELAGIVARSAAALAARAASSASPAEAGMGKSRLVAEVVARRRAGGIVVAFGECQSFGTNASYFGLAARSGGRLLGLDDGDRSDEQMAALERELAAIDPALVPRAPLLGGCSASPIPDNDLTRVVRRRSCARRRWRCCW